MKHVSNLIWIEELCVRENVRKVVLDELGNIAIHFAGQKLQGLGDDLMVVLARYCCFVSQIGYKIALVVAYELA